MTHKIWKRGLAMSARNTNNRRGIGWRGSIWTRARAVASLGMVFGLGALGTMAYWVDNATVTTGEFSVASLDLQVNDSTAFSWPLSASGMMPGDTAAAELIVQNKGGVDFDYTATVNSSESATLAPYMTLTVKSGATLNEAAGTCTGGTQIGSNTLQVGVDRSLISSPRTLPSSGSETLCFQVQLSNAVSKTVSNQSVNAIVEFTATS